MWCSSICLWYIVGWILVCWQFFAIDALDNGLALTPPMGWMSWERYRCIIDCDLYPDDCISERLIKSVADHMVSKGYKAAGYEYVIIDDCWLETERDPITNELVPDRKRFPSGIKALADYIHEKGLKIGIYEDYGTNTCAGYPGIIDHMELHANTFARWQIDYVKLDGCYADYRQMDVGYPEFGRFLNKTGRPMVYSCSWPVYQEYEGLMPNYELLKMHCNLWRNWDDIQDSYESLLGIVHYFGDNQSRIQPHGGKGHWNDPDMLIIGNFGLSLDQSKMQMAIWAILAAPLIMSTDLIRIRTEFKAILLNNEIIAVNQDELGIQGLLVRNEQGIQCWIRPITPIVHGSHSYAIAWTSTREDGVPRVLSYNLTDLGLTYKHGYHVTDLFNKDNSFVIQQPCDDFQVRINPTGVVFYKFIPRKTQPFLYWIQVLRIIHNNVKEYSTFEMTFETK